MNERTKNSRVVRALKGGYASLSANKSAITKDLQLKNIKKKSCSERGITLLALGITIVILLILAGITMNMLTGDHGMIDEATNASIQSETAKVHEDWGLYIKSQDLKRIKEHDFSEPTIKEDLAGVVTEVETSDGYNLGIISDFKRLEIDTEYGKGSKDVSAGKTSKKMEELDDVFAIDFATNKTYYIKDGRMWSVGGEVSAADVENDHKESQTKNIMINRVIYNNKKLDVLTATVSPEKETADVKLASTEVKQITLKVNGKEVVMDPYAWSLDKNIDPNDAEIDGIKRIEPEGTATGLKEDTTYYMIYKGKIGRDLTKPDGSKEHVEQEVYGTPDGNTSQGTLPSPAVPSADPDAPTQDPMAPPSSWTDPEQQPTPGQGETPENDGDWEFQGWTNGDDPSAPVVDPTDPNLPPDADLHAKYKKTVTVKRFIYENTELEELTGTVYRNDVKTVPAKINLKSTGSISININEQTYTAEPRGWSTDPRPSATITVGLNQEATVYTSMTYHASYKYQTKYKYVDPATGAETEKDKEIYVGSDGTKEGDEPLQFPSDPEAPKGWGTGWEFKGWSKDEDPSKQDQIVDPATEVPNPNQVYHPTYSKKVTLHRFEKGPSAVADVTGTAYQNEKKKELAHIDLGTVSSYETNVADAEGGHYQAEPYAWYKGDPAPHKGEIDGQTLIAPNTVIDTDEDGQNYYMNYKYTKKYKTTDPATGEDKELQQDVYVGSNGTESPDPVIDPETGETPGGEQDPDHTKNVSPEKKEEGYKQEAGTGKAPDNITEGHNIWTTEPEDPSNPEYWVDPLNPDPSKPIDPTKPLQPVLYKEVQAKTHEFEEIGRSKENDLGKKKVYTTNEEYVEPAAFELGTAKQISFQYKQKQQLANPRHWSTEKKAQSPAPEAEESKEKPNATSVKNGGIAYLTQDADYYMSYTYTVQVTFTSQAGVPESKESTVYVDSEGNVEGDENFEFPATPDPSQAPEDSGLGPNGDGSGRGNSGGLDPENPDEKWQPNGWVEGTDPTGEVINPESPDFNPDSNADYHYTWKREVKAKMFIYKNQELTEVTGTAYKNNVKETPAELQLETAQKTTIKEGDYNIEAEPRHWSVDKSPTAAEPNDIEKWNENAVANGGKVHLLNNQTYYMSYTFTIKLKYKAQDGSEKQLDQKVYVGSDGTIVREEVNIPAEDTPTAPAGTQGFEKNIDDASNENPNHPEEVENPDKFTGHELWTTNPADPSNKNNWVDPLDPNLKLQDGQTIYPVFRKKITVHKHVLDTTYSDEEGNEIPVKDEDVCGYSYVSTDAGSASLAEINLGNAYDVKNAETPEVDIAKPRHWSQDNSAQSAAPIPGQEAKNEQAVGLNQSVHLSHDKAEYDYYMSYQFDITIHFEKNGGTGEVPDDITQTIYKNSEGEATEYKHQFQEDQKTPTKEGFTFMGWSTSSVADKPDENMVVGREASFSKTTTLYAIWDGDAPVITFDPDGSDEYKKKQETKVTVESPAGLDITTAKYVWTQSSSKPGAEETDKEKEHNFTETLSLAPNAQSPNKKEATVSLEGKTGNDWYLWVYAEDARGHIKISTASSAFFVDNQPPTDDKPECSQTLVTITAIFEQKDENSGINNSEISWGIKDADIGGEITWTKAAETTHKFTDLKPGTNYEIYSKAVDNAGNEEVISQKADCQTTALEKPIIEISPESEWTKDTVRVTIAAGVENEESKIQYTETPEVEQSWQDYTNSPFTVDHNCTITARNVTNDLKYGTNNTTEKQIKNIDKDLPEITSIDVNKLHITIKAKDKTSGISAKAITQNGDLQPGGRIYESVDPKTEEQTFEFDATSKGTWYVYFCDQAKNFVKQEFNLTDTDIEGPKITIEPETNPNWQKTQEATVTVEGRETSNPVVGEDEQPNNFGVNESSLKYLWNDDGESVPDKGDFQKTFQNKGKVTISEDTEGQGVTGEKYLWIYAEDTKGNPTIVGSQVFKVDNQKPNTTEPLATADVTSVKVTAQQEDAHSGIDEATWNFTYRKYPEGEWQEWTPDSTGTHTFEGLELNSEYEFKTRVADKAGNEAVESEAKRVQTLKISKPLITAKPEGSPEGNWTNSDVEITITYSKSKGLTNQYMVDGENWLEYPTDKTVKVSENGTTVKARSIVTGKKEQTSEIAEKTIDYIDKTAPEIVRFSQLTQNMTAEAVDNESKIVKWKFDQEENAMSTDLDWNEVEEGPQASITKEQKATQTGPWFFHVMNKAGGISTRKLLVDGNLGAMTGEVTPDNYGDEVDIGQDLNGDNNTTNDWVLFYSNNQNVYLISKEYLASSEVPAGAGMTANGTHAVYWNSLSGTGSSEILENVATKFMLGWRAQNPASTINSAKAVAKLLNTETWNKFAVKGSTDLDGIQSVGSPTIDMFVASWNQKEKTKITTSVAANGYTVTPESLSAGNALYFPTGESEATGYWLSSPSAAAEDNLLVVKNGEKALGNAAYNTNTYAVRPVIALPEDATGTKDDTGVWKPQKDPEKALEPTIVVNTDKWAKTKTVTVRWPADSGIEKKYSTDGSQWDPYTMPVEISKNNTKFQAKAIRNGDEASAQIASKTIDKIDESAPTVNEPISDNGKVQAKITITAQDNESGLAKYMFNTMETVQSDTDGWQNVDGATEEQGATDEKQFTYTSDKNTTVYFHAMDLVGRITDKKIDITSIDTAAPTIVSFTAANTVNAEGKIVLTGKAYDNESGLVGWQVSQNSSLADESQGWEAIEPTKVSDSSDPFETTYSVETLGTYYFYAKDAKGNIATSDPVEVGENNFKNIVPEITTSPAGWQKQKTVKIQYASVEGLKNEYKTTDDAAYTDAKDTNPVTFPITKNTTINAQSTHEASGTTKAAAAFIEDHIDTEKPTPVSITAAAPVEQAGKKTVTLTAKCTDNQSGIAKYQFVTTDSGAGSASPSSSWQTVSSPDDTIGKEQQFTTTIEENKKVWFFCQDQAGNEASASEDVTTLNKEDHPETDVNVGSVTVGSTKLSKGWKYFCTEGDTVTLIYANTLENGAIPTSSGINISGENVSASSNRDTLVNYLKGTAWNTLQTAVRTALTNRGIKDVSQVTVKGAPTPEQAALAWNEHYANKSGWTLSVKSLTQGQSVPGISSASAAGYVYNWNPPGTETYATAKSISNYQNYPLFFRDSSNNMNHWWLAGPSAGNSDYVCIVYFSGNFNYSGYYDSYGVRPVVSLPKSVFEELMALPDAPLDVPVDGNIDLGSVTSGSTKLSGGFDYFCTEGDDVKIIYDTYLENAAIPSTGTISKNQRAVWSTSNRDDLINFLKGTGNYTKVWDNLKTGIQNALSAKGVQKSDYDKVTVTGAPTLEQTALAWNEHWESSEGKKLKVQTNSTGYQYSLATTGSTSWTTAVQDTNYTSKPLFWPHTSSSGYENAYGWWLAGPSANSSGYVCSVYYSGNFSCHAYNYGIGVRPVVSIPKSLFRNVGNQLNIKI